jgi:uncharacterized protein YbjT (DUF2867 family)
MIIVTGATGKLGSRIVERLLSRVPASEVGVSVRDPAQAAALADRGVRVRAGDFADPEALDAAFEDATRVLVVSAGTTGDEAVNLHRTAIDAARRAGAERVLYTSHQAAAPDSLFAPMPDHATTEAHLAAGDAPFTALRNGFYASTVPLLLGAALRTGELVAPEDGPVSWTAHADLAEAAALTLTGDGPLDGVTPPLTAPVALDLEQVAAELSGVAGRPVRRLTVGDEEWAAGLVGHGVPAAQAELLLGLFRAARRGEFAATDGTLEALLGRPATPLRTTLEQAVAAA